MDLNRLPENDILSSMILSDLMKTLLIDVYISEGLWEQVYISESVC